MKGFKLKHLSAVVVLAMGTGQSVVLAADYVTKANTDVTVQSTMAYWTPERLANAKPLDIPKVSSKAVLQADNEAPATTGTPASADGRGPTVNVPPNMANRLFDPAMAPQWNADTGNADTGIQPFDRGTSGYNYTSSRLIPTTADTSYPYRTIGKLFFTKPGVGNFVCSGSVIQRRIIATAGHCVHSGNGAASGWYTNFLFVPAYRNGAAPYNTWSWAYVRTTTTWYTGGGAVPNAADYAMIEVNDKVINGVTRRVGDLTGWLGWQTASLSNNHAHILGYPGNLDSGLYMHQVTAQSAVSGGNNTWRYGSDMRGGSSGGPFVQNFSVPAAGQPAGLNPGLNRLISVVSYGPVDTNPKYQGASILDSRWTSMWTAACARRAGNCN